MESSSPTDPSFNINSVIRRKSIGDDVNFFDTEFTPLMQVDLDQYPNGMEVTVEENEMSGQILFSPKPHYS